MKKIFFLAIRMVFLILANETSAQLTIENAGTKSLLQKIKCNGTTNNTGADSKWQFILLGKEIRHKTIESDQKIIDSIKAAKFKQKIANLVKDSSENKSEYAVPTPVRGTNFQGNVYNYFYPLDNSIAISNGGYTVSVINSTIQVFNLAGSSQYFNSLAGFFNDPEITSVYDPHVIYDRIKDRFIFVGVSGKTSSTSKILICFSKTNNPSTGGWWKYKTSGNPLDNGCWSDYPKIAVTNAELIISANLFSNSNSFNQAIIFQWDKNEGFSGLSMSGIFWSNISGAPSSILPVSHGQGSSTYGPYCYLVSTISSGGSIVRLYKITDDQYGSPAITYNTISVSSYSVPGDATQKGTSNLLDVGDCRALDGFYLNGTIHFVLNNDKGSGWCGVRYFRLNTSSLTSSSHQWYGSGNNDYAYGAVASFATSYTDKSVMITMCRTSADYYPELRAVRVDNIGTYSGSITIKSGSSYVNVSTSSTERWGDYTGVARRHNSSTPSVWVGGAFGTTSHNWSTWISEIHSGSLLSNPSVNVSDISDIKSKQLKTKVFPQPITETFTLEFNLPSNEKLTIILLNSNGTVVKNLFKGNAFAGTNVLSFNKGPLPAGTYILLGTDEKNNTVLKEKIIIGK